MVCRILMFMWSVGPYFLMQTHHGRLGELQLLLPTPTGRPPQSPFDVQDGRYGVAVIWQPGRAQQRSMVGSKSDVMSLRALARLGDGERARPRTAFCELQSRLFVVGLY